MSAAPASPAPAPAGGRDPAGLVVAVGVLHALLFLLSFALLTRAPRVTAPDPELIDFYASPQRRRLVLVGLFVMPFAGITFLWFSMALRGWLRAGAAQARDMVWGLYLASAYLYVALFFCGAAAAAVAPLASEQSQGPHDPLLLRVFPQFGYVLLTVFGMRMAAMFVVATSRLGRMAGVVARGYARLGLLVGAFLLLVPTTDRRLVLVFPLWILGLCVQLWLHRGAAAGRAPDPRPQDAR